MLRVISITLALTWTISMTAGCAFNRGNIGEKLDEDTVRKLEKGVTTRTEVVSMLGAPDRIVRAHDHDVLQYYHYDVKSSSLLLILINFSRVNAKSDDLYVLVNHDGVVDEVLFGRRTHSLEFNFWPFGD